jgi:hypothetical protein
LQERLKVEKTMGVENFGERNFSGINLLYERNYETGGRKMKKTMFAIVCVIGLLMAVTNAQAISLTIGDAFYVGSINDGIPSSPALEQGYVANLITLVKGAEDTQIPEGTGEIYNREGSTLDGPFPEPLGFKKIDEDGNTDFVVTGAGTFYVLGKYDQSFAGALVWLVTATAGETISLPSTYNGYNLSHITSNAPVPEPITMLLLGFGFVGLVGFTRIKSIRGMFD